MVVELSIVEQIKLLMDRKGVTQKEVADFLGISNVHFCNILNGKIPIHKVRKKVMKELARYLNTTFHVNLLLGSEDNDKKTTNEQ